MSEVFNRIEREIPRLRRYAWAITRDRSAAEDLLQDSLTRALVKAHLWQHGTDLRAWLFTILHHEHVNTIRRSVLAANTFEANGLDPNMAVGPSQIHSLELRRLERALTKLPEGQRHVVLLIGMEGLSYEETAKVLDIPLGTVRSRLSRGRDTLRVLLDQGPADRSTRKPETEPRQSRRSVKEEHEANPTFDSRIHEGINPQ